MQSALSFAQMLTLERGAAFGAMLIAPAVGSLRYVYTVRRESWRWSLFLLERRVSCHSRGEEEYIYIYTDAMLMAVAGGHGKQCILLYAAICEM